MAFKILVQRVLPDGDVALKGVPLTKKSFQRHLKDESIIIDTKRPKWAMFPKQFMKKHPQFGAKKAMKRPRMSPYQRLKMEMRIEKIAKRAYIGEKARAKPLAKRGFKPWGFYI